MTSTHMWGPNSKTCRFHPLVEFTFPVPTWDDGLLATVASATKTAQLSFSWPKGYSAQYLNRTTVHLYSNGQSQLSV